MDLSFQKEVREFNKTLENLYQEAFFKFAKEDEILQSIKDDLPFISSLYNEKLNYNNNHFNTFIFNSFKEVLKLKKQSPNYFIEELQNFSIHYSLLLYFFKSFKELEIKSKKERELLNDLYDYFAKSKSLDTTEFFLKFFNDPDEHARIRIKTDEYNKKVTKIQSECLKPLFDVEVVKKLLNKTTLTDEEENKLFHCLKSVYFNSEQIEDFRKLIKKYDISTEIKDFYKQQEQNRESDELTYSFFMKLIDLKSYLKSFDSKLSKIFRKIKFKNNKNPQLKELLQKAIIKLIDGEVDFNFVQDFINHNTNCSRNRREYYAGIGAREIPENVGNFMTKFADEIENTYIVLRSGGAKGSDKAFENGVRMNANKNIFYAEDADLMSYFAAYLFHPTPYILSKNEYAKKLMARNTLQILGDLSSDVIEPSLFVVCWTKDGAETHKERTKETGGTGQAISIADIFNIPVINLKNILLN